MKYAMLAPVPCMHLPSALELCAREGRVAFGTNKEDWFDLDGKPEEGWPVLIYASCQEFGDPKKFFRPACASFAATLVGWTQANNQGKHPNPEVRPPSTVDDTAWFGFWQVSDLHKPSAPIRFADLRRSGLKKFAFGFEPHGPIVVQGEGF